MFELAKKACGVGGPPTRSGVNNEHLFQLQRTSVTKLLSMGWALSLSLCFRSVSSLTQPMPIGAAWDLKDKGFDSYHEILRIYVNLNV